MSATKGTACTDNGGTRCDGNGLCVLASCVDGVKDGTETDVDCGGSGACSRCANGKMCLVGSDCTSALCANMTCAGCTKDSDCGMGNFCDTTTTGGTCAPTKPLGVACTANGQCASGNCVGPAGTQICCAVACMDNGAASCGTNGACTNDGSACQTYPFGAMCGSSCPAGSFFLTPSTCNAQSQCTQALGGKPCPNGFSCNMNGMTCNTSCAGDSDCATTFYCKNPGSNGTCAVQMQDGSACTADDQCMNGNCQGGKCSQPRAAGAACTSNSECAAPGVCGVNGTGHCCTAACTPGPCATDCDMNGNCAGPGSSMACSAQVMCDTTNPNGNLLTTGSGTCDGMGNCAQTTTVCGNNLRCKNGACLTSCPLNNTFGDHACVPGFYCGGSTCLPTNGPGGACNRPNMCTSGMCNGTVCG
jgi:hypothetical protein